MQERVVAFPGSFDPITYGHLDVAERAAELFDRVTLSVAREAGKCPLFSAEERADLCRGACADLPNVEVDIFSGLIVEHARRRGAAAIIKGLRWVSDFDREMQMALMNRAMAPGMPTLFLMSAADHSFLSSSLVKEVCSLGGDVSRFVPPNVLAALQERLCPA